MNDQKRTACTPAAPALRRRPERSVEPQCAGAFEGLWSSRRLRAWLLALPRGATPPMR